MEKTEAIRQAAADEYFLTVQEAAQHDQLFRDAGFPLKNYLYGLPRPGDLVEEAAVDTALDTLQTIYGLDPATRDAFQLIWPSYLMRPGYQPFTSDEPFWIVSFHTAEGIYVVALDAATGQILHVNYDPAASGNG